MLVIKVYFNLVLLLSFDELSSVIPIILLVYMDFFVNNYKLCLLYRLTLTLLYYFISMNEAVFYT